MSNNYTVLHLHSDMSNGVTNIDSVTKYQDYVKRAQELNMTALAFSEHGSVFDWHGKKEAIEKAGMKYIHAAEFYITEKINLDESGNPIKLRDNWHCLLIARNFEGVKEIKDYAFESSEYITSVTLPQSLTHIGRCAFDRCRMTSVVIPENVCYIAEHAFGWVSTKLQSVTLGRGVMSIGDEAFGYPKYNKKLRIYVPAGMKKEYCARKGFEIYKSKIKEIKE